MYRQIMGWIAVLVLATGTAHAEIDSKTGFSGRNVGMALVFWPGIIVNESQASSAEAAAVARLDRLNQLYYERGCLEKEQRH